MYLSKQEEIKTLDDLIGKNINLFYFGSLLEDFGYEDFTDFKSYLDMREAEEDNDVFLWVKHLYKPMKEFEEEFEQYLKEELKDGYIILSGDKIKSEYKYIKITFDVFDVIGGDDEIDTVIYVKDIEEYFYDIDF